MPPFMLDAHELKPGLVLFRRADVKHNNWYCRIKIPGEDRYKTTSLKTPDLHLARDRAMDVAADLRFRLQHDVPVFDKPFRQVAQQFLDHQELRAQADQITQERWRVQTAHVRQLTAYTGSAQISRIGSETWNGYPIWRKRTGRSRAGKRDSEQLPPPSDGTIKSEMATFRSIMEFAASRNYIKDTKAFSRRPAFNTERRDAFTPEEYRKLHRFARKWIRKANNSRSAWSRSMAYNFMLVMANTGMRPSEARNLRWRDVTGHTDRQGREFASLSVSGKSKARELVAAHSVLAYLKRIRALSKATRPEDPVFTSADGTSAKRLYAGLIQDLFKESGLLLGPSGKPRSTYCFRHTYATFRLAEGIDVYFLAKQMGTSVQMIEDHYGHVTPVKNAERILQGIPGWEPIRESPERPTRS